MLAFDNGKMAVQLISHWYRNTPYYGPSVCIWIQGDWIESAMGIHFFHEIGLTPHSEVTGVQYGTVKSHVHKLRSHCVRLGYN